MEALLVLLLVIAIILLITLINKTSEHHRSINSLRETINELSQHIWELSRKKPESPPAANKIEVEEKPKPVTPPPIATTEEKKVPAITSLYVPKEEKAPLAETKGEETPQVKLPAPKPIASQQPGWWQNWVKNNPDLEKFIGENLANKIGIAVLVLGISFFVKYAIDKDWINEVGRVIIGLVAGGLLIALAHRTRKSYRSFSSVLVGGGLTVFYFTIAYAFHQYHLMPQSAAFTIMVVITAFAVGLSLLYDRMELAVLATLGGFVTPFLVSTGQENYVALFTYLAILNAGLMVLAWFKRWTAINFIALFFTILIYGGWLGRRMWINEGNLPTFHAMLFATIFYFQFLIMNILNNLKSKRKFGAFDFVVVFSVNSLYYAAGMFILKLWMNGDYQGLFTASLGVVNLALAWYFFRRKQMDKNFIYLLIGLTISFISLAAPVQLKGNHITLFWAAESVVLFWLFQRSRIALIKVFSVLVLVVTFVSLLMDWEQVYHATTSLPIILNRGFVTNIVVSGALFTYHMLMRREADSYYLGEITNRFVRRFLLAGGIILLFMTGVLETWYQFSHHFPDSTLYILYLDLYIFLFANILFVFLKKTANLRIMITALCFAVYVLSMSPSYDLSFEMLRSGVGRIHFLAHWLADILFIKLLIDLTLFIKNNINHFKKDETVFNWFLSFGFVLFLSMEMYLLLIWASGANGGNWDYWQNLYVKAGLSITWGVCAFIMMWLGMRFSNKTLRVISLTLILITLAKLFLNDIRNIPEGGKIAAFILLGVLLLIISFMYQRLKKIIIDDKGENK